MNKNRILAAVVFALSFLVFNFSGLLAQDNPDGCLVYLDSTAQSAFGPRDTLRAVAIWISSAGNPRGTKLPTYWRQVWSANELISVPSFYRENSDSAGVPRFVLQADVYGASDSSCIIATLGTCQNISTIAAILDSADKYVDFTNYDRNGDGFVDAFFICISDSGDAGLTPICQTGTYTTKDSVGSTPPKKIAAANTAYASAFNREDFVQTMCHELGHYITAGGLLEYYARTPVWWVTGSFTVMGKKGFQYRASPFHPFQNHKFLGWDQPVDINSTSYNQQIEPYFSSMKKFYRIKKSSTEYFEVSYHIADPTGSIWERQWPATGLLIAHINDTVVNPLSFSRKQIDLELPHGLRTYSTDPNCYPNCFTTPNDSTGRDSLDDVSAYPIANGDSLLPRTDAAYGSNIGSATCLWPVTISGVLKNAFDDKTNPSSRVYGTAGQNALSRLAVENMVLNGSTASADFIVNAQFGEISSNTTWGPGVVGVIGDVRVKNGATLTIAAGTTIKFQRNYDNQKLGSDTTKCGVTVESGGSLIVNGTSGSPVLFVSSSTSPGTNDWEGIKVKRGGSARLEYGHIRNAYTGIEYETGVLAADTIKNVHIAQCQAYGIRTDSTPNLVIRNCGIDSISADPGGVGISISAVGPRLIGDTIRASFYGISVSGSNTAIDSCSIYGPGNIGLKVNGQTNYLAPLQFKNGVINGYFSLAHVLTFISAQLSLSNVIIQSSITPARSPYGLQSLTNINGTLKARRCQILDWGTAGALTGHNSGGTLDLGWVAGVDSGYNSIYTSMTGSSWKYVKDVDCNNCSQPTIFAEWNCWNTFSSPPSSRFSTNVDYSPFSTFCLSQPDPKIASGGGEGVLPKPTELYQNYPNPFNPTTLIQFNLEKTERVHLHIFNILGQKVRTMLRGEEFSAGPYTFLWNGRDDGGNSLSSGVYFYKLSTPSYSQTKKMSLVK